MFEYLKGYITAVHATYVVLDVNGVGYLIYTSGAGCYQVDSQHRVTIYIHQVVTDSFQALYGFYDLKTKTLFERLINVSGIGPKNANAILAGNQNNALLNAINEENITFLTQFPGVGKKTAKQLVLDLKGKLDDLLEADLFNPQGSTVSNQGDNEALNDAIAALTALGYSKRDVEKIKPQLSKKPDLTTNDYLSLGMKLLTRN